MQQLLDVISFKYFEQAFEEFFFFQSAERHGSNFANSRVPRNGISERREIAVQTSLLEEVLAKISFSRFLSLSL